MVVSQLVALVLCFVLFLGHAGDQNPGPHAHQASALSLSYIPQPTAFSADDNLLELNNFVLILTKIAELLDCTSLLWVIFTMDSKPEGVV